MCEPAITLYGSASDIFYKFYGEPFQWKPDQEGGKYALI